MAGFWLIILPFLVGAKTPLIDIADGCVQKTHYKMPTCKKINAAEWNCCIVTADKSVCSKNFQPNYRLKRAMSSLTTFVKYKVLLVADITENFDLFELISANQSRYCEAMTRQAQCVRVSQIETMRNDYFQVCPTTMFPLVIDTPATDLTVKKKKRFLKK